MIPTHLLTQLFGPPEFSSGTPNWHGHIPFARWLVHELRPESIVELGVFRGDSYLAFCEACVRFGTGTKLVGIDSWEGDAQAGVLPAEVYEELSAVHDPRYSGSSKLLRSRFEDCVDSFADGSIDILHIDGLHTYEAVRNDFETWSPKVRDGGVILFHDTAVREGDFGVWRLWEEITASRPHFTFGHSHGLGALPVGSLREPLQWLTSPSTEDARAVADLFAWLGATCAGLAALGPSGVRGYEPDPAFRDPYAQMARIAAGQSRPDRLQREIERLRHEIDSLHSSTSWRITRPLRRLRGDRR